MSITEILQESAVKQVNKSSTGDPIINGVVIGTVRENNSDEFPGMVRVQVKTRDRDKDVLDWMYVVSNMAGKSWGGYFIPEIGDQVVVVFQDGNINKGYVIGSIYKRDTNMLSKNFTEENYNKVFKTKGGNTFKIYDEDDKQKIEIITNNEKSLKLNDEKETMSMSDKDGENAIIINSKDGKTTIKANKKVIIDVNGTMIEVLGDSNKVSIKCGTLNINADQNINIQSQSITIDAKNTLNIKGAGNAQLTSNGVVKLAGSLIKMG